MLDIKQVDSFPKRGYMNKNSEERAQIAAALEAGNPSVIENVDDDRAKSLDQRIRNAAAKLGIKVTISYQRNGDGTGDIYFAKREDND